MRGVDTGRDPSRQGSRSCWEDVNPREISKSVISKRYIMPSQILVQFWSNSGSIVSGVTTQQPPPPPEAQRSLDEAGN